VKSLKQSLEVEEVMWEIVVMVLTFGGWEKGKWIDAKPGGKNQPTKSKVYSLVAKESWKQ
jgi:hypothetical protein